MKNRFLSILICICLLSTVSCVKEPQAIPVNGVTINPTSLSLVEGEMAEIIATVSPVDADNQKIIWTSSDESIVSVSQGRVYAIKAKGSVSSATITAKTDDGGYIAECSVAVWAIRIDQPQRVYQVSNDEQDINIDITSNVSFNCSIDEIDKSWVSYVQTKAVETNTLIFHVTSNESYETRRAVIRVTFEGIERDVVIAQGGKPIPFVDQTLSDLLVKKYDRNFDYRVTSDEVDNVTELTIDSSDIHSIDGLQYFANLKELRINQNRSGEIPEVDVSGYNSLEELYLSNSNTSRLIVSGAPNLQVIWCDNNSLTELDLRECIHLQEIYCGYNNIKVLDLSNNLELEVLSCYNCGLERLLLPSVDSGLRIINCGNNDLAELDLSRFRELEVIDCYNNRITSLGELNCPNLVNMWCFNNGLTSISLNTASKLSHLSCSDNPILSIDLHDHIWLESLDCSNCRIEELDLSGCVNLKTVFCVPRSDDAIELKKAYLPKGYNCNLYFPSITTIIEINTGQNDGIISNLDPYFKEMLLKASIYYNGPKIDRNNDGEISLFEAKCVQSIECNSSLVKSLSGIEYFVNLESVQLENGKSKVADFSSNTKLSSIYYSGQDLESIVFPQTSSLKQIELFGCQLNTIDVSMLDNLEWLKIGDTGIVSLDVSHNLRLGYLWLDNNPLEELVMGAHPFLWGLCVANCSLDHLDVSTFKKLNSFQSIKNNIKVLDLHENTALTMVRCDSPSLETLYLFKDYYSTIKDFQSSGAAIIIK